MQSVPRLINKFRPTNYKLFIKLNRTERTFAGKETIEGAIQNDANNISLHSKNTNITSIKINGANATFSSHDNDELLISHPDIHAGQCNIEIEFNGKITDQMHGLYPCCFEHNGEKKELLATQFESHHAREVFPCIDEPEAKATFDLTLDTEKNVATLSNMPIKNQEEIEERLITSFETTPKMSTYLLAWVVGEMQKKSARTKNGVEVNVWSTPAQPMESLDLALDIACRVTDFFDEYFDTPYPLPKCDHVALPDFSSGAMENWGLITYRELLMLFDPKTSSITHRNYAASVIAHELSHQWFGNLVTMKWWNDLWLNESFATMIEYLAIDAIEPNWNIWLSFACHEIIASLRRDSIDGVQPIEVEVHHPDEIMSLFDGAIMYAKGARLIRMMQQYVGEEVFRDSLRLYFKTHAYGNTEASDLWKAISQVSHSDIESIMKTWLSQPGFPIVSVSKYDNSIQLSQKRLSTSTDKNSDQLWQIPLGSNCPNLPKIFDTRSISINEVNYDPPLIINKSGYGHFIAQYDGQLFTDIIEQIKSNNLSEIDRLQIINEQSILAKTGNIKNSELIPLLYAYKNETKESVWDIMCITIGDLKKFVENDESAEKMLQKMTAELASNEYDKLGWYKKENEDESDSKLRQIIIGLMKYSERKDVINFAIEKFHSTPLYDLDPDLRSLIISNAVRRGNDPTIVDKLIVEYKNCQSPEIQNDICAGITTIKDTSKLDSIFGIIQDQSVVRLQDIFRWIIHLLRNRYTREQTWQWIRNNWDWVENNFEGDKSFDDIPKYAGATLSTRKQLQEYQDFFLPMRNQAALTRVIDMGINEITDRINIIERDSQAVKEALMNIK